jgi:hypothetical protein
MDFDLVLLHEEADSLDEAVGYLAAAIEGGFIVEFEVVEAEAEFFATMFEGMGDFGVFEEGFGGDAADVETDTAEGGLFDDGRF